MAKGADIIVAQGGEAGGHGISCGSLSLFPAVVDAVGYKVPVALAGGVADGRGLAAALMLGGQGVVLGTRFYASEEAAGLLAAKNRIVLASGDDTFRSVVFDVSRERVWPAPYTGRCLKNKHLERWAGRELDLMRQGDAERLNFREALKRGDYEIAPVIAGEAVSLIHDILPAAAIVRSIATEAGMLLTEGHMCSREKARVS